MDAKATPTTAVLNVWFASGLQMTYNLTAQAGVNVSAEIGLGLGGGGSAAVQVTPTEWINANEVERFTCVLS